MALAGSAGLLMLGVVLAARRFPGGFDWAYTVISALASRKHNPDGAVYFALGLAFSLTVLWPTLNWIQSRDRIVDGLALFGVRALRTGVIFGVIVGVERLSFYHASQLVRKSHEAVAAVSFLSFYVGVIVLYVDRVRRGAMSPWPAVITLTPLVAIGISQLGLYLGQRDLGWVGQDWREMGVQVWWSFAFWQWLSAGAIWASIGHLVMCRPLRPA